MSEPCRGVGASEERTGDQHSELTCLSSVGGLLIEDLGCKGQRLGLEPVNIES